MSLEQTGRDRESQLKALGTVLGWFEKDPQLSLLASDVEFTTASVYNNAAQRVSEHQIEHTKLTEEQLRALGEITRLLRTDVDKLRETHEQAAHCPLGLSGKWTAIWTSCKTTAVPRENGVMTFTCETPDECSAEFLANFLPLPGDKVGGCP